MDKLDEIFDLQDSLNQRIGVDTANLSDEDKTKKRLNVDIKVNLKNIENIRFFPRYRFRLQHELDDGNSNNLVIRNKIKHEYSLKNKFTPFSFFEFFHTYENNSLIFDKYRLGFGVEYKHNKNQTIVLYYIYDSDTYYQESMSNNPIYNSSNIFSLKFKYSL